MRGDDLAFFFYLGNQLDLTTSMVGDVFYCVGLVVRGSGKLVYMEPVFMIVGVEQEGGAYASQSSRLNILCDFCFLTVLSKNIQLFQNKKILMIYTFRLVLIRWPMP